MRTFHTGGVFSGDLAKQIRAPFTGTLKYNLNSKTSVIRTIHGEKGFNLLENVKLQIVNSTNTLCSLDIPNGAMLLANNNQKVYCNQVIAEIKKDTSLLLEEARRDIYTEVSGEVFLQNVKIKESIDSQGTVQKVSKTAGLIWVLHGERFLLQKSSKLEVKVGENFSPNSRVIGQKVRNKYPGIVNFDNLSENREISVVNSAMVIENGLITKTSEPFADFELTTSKNAKLFQLCVKENELLKQGQTIACLKENAYKTETGGVIYYSTVEPESKKKRNTKKLFAGFLYWVPEETHQLSSTNFENLKESLQILRNLREASGILANPKES